MKNTIFLLALGMAFTQNSNAQELGDVIKLKQTTKGINVGIGIDNPERPFHIRGRNNIMRLDRNSNSPSLMFVRFNQDYSSSLASFQMGAEYNTSNGTGNFFISDLGGAVTGSGVKRFVINQDGNVGIGTGIDLLPSAHRLSVNGSILATGLKIAAYNSADWADYVFKQNYALMPLYSLETYVKTNSHLPEIPSAAEVEEKGIDLVKMNVLLLKKVEELTLYTIQQQKEIDALKESIQK